MSDQTSRITVDTVIPGYWRVKLTHPPVNTIDERMYDELFDLVEAMEADAALKVVTFESTDRDFFIAHYGIGETKSRFDAPRWIDTAARLERSPVVSIAVVRGRARGGGSEFALACDMRFASREKAIFGQPEVGFGLIPGGGGLERLPLLVGRSRALEIALGGDDFNADTAERYGWINRAIPDSELDGFVAELVRRILSFDSHVLASAKAILNKSGLPTRAQLDDTQATFSQLLRSPVAKERLTTAVQRGLGASREYELNLGLQTADL